MLQLLTHFAGFNIPSLRTFFGLWRLILPLDKSLGLIKIASILQLSAFGHTYTRTLKQHTYIHAYIHIYTRTCIYIYIQTYTQAYMSACLSGMYVCMYVCMTVCIHICYARRQTAKHVELHFRRASRNRMYKALACLLRSSGVSGCHVWGLGFTYRLRD